jgi:hypothetical protein
MYNPKLTGASCTLGGELVKMRVKNATTELLNEWRNATQLLSTKTQQQIGWQEDRVLELSSQGFSSVRLRLTFRTYHI